ncbi:DUF4253 domain-containing protein [Paenibacillus shenyangensis]|uniref:DUF4253 domain-containing protein n=1 Tax=Paenibacillus sp. A9 TaxID=1284352 RepID=UPI00037253FA|nr:DUF4253 domain-containing protein [Paenibacillus sp. A9]
MSEQMLEWLENYETETIQPENVIYPDASHTGQHRLLVLPNDNIEELIEDVIGEKASLADYVEQSAAADTLPLTEALRRAMTWLWESSELPENYQPLEKLSMDELFAAYRHLAEADGALDYFKEQIIAGDKTLPVPDAAWASDRAEDGAIWLTLPQGQEYHAPLIIPMGGFNECPLPTLQSAVFREWQQQYGAIPIAVNDSTWILRAQRRPQTDEQALELAKQHMLFCNYVLEDFETIGSYAGYLKQQDIWYFWWD